MLFAQLSKEAQQPRRLRTLRWYDQNKCEPHAVGALNGLLETLEGLRTVDVYLEDMPTLPRVDGIVKQKATLQSLSLHSQDANGTLLFYSEADFARICTECLALRQLSLMFPFTKVHDCYPSQDFRACLVRPPPAPNLPTPRTERDRVAPLTIVASQKLTAKLPELTVLNIRRWPTPPRDSSFTGHYHRIAQLLTLYEHQLQRLTQRIFTKFDEAAPLATHGRRTRARLAVVAWGPNGRSKVDPADTFKAKQVPFVRGARTDPFGATELLAVQVPWRLVQFVEGESDVLDHSVGLPNWPFGIFHTERP